MTKITAVIIDDMELARKSLHADLTALCTDIEIVGQAESVVTGAKLVKQVKPDLIFLDIQLTDGNGFDILELCAPITAQVIFTTASDAFAIKAFRFSAVDYLLKPIDPEQLQAAVMKAGENLHRNNDHYSTISENYQSPRKLVLHTAELIKVVDISEILRLESMGNYTQFFFIDNSKLLITKTLKEYDELLSDGDFLRVHQSHLINLSHLRSYIKTEGGYLLMQDDSRVPVSVRKKPQVMDAIEAYAKRVK